MQGILAALGCALVGLVVWLARQNGKQSAHIEELKKEAEEYAKSQQIMDSVHSMPVDTVRQRLQDRTK